MIYYEKTKNNVGNSCCDYDIRALCLRQRRRKFPFRRPDNFGNNRCSYRYGYNNSGGSSRRVYHYRKSVKITIPKLENTVKIDNAKFESSVVPDGKYDSFNSTITVEGNDRKFNITIKDGSIMGKTSLEVAEKLNKGEEDDDKKYKACEIAGFKGILKVNTYSGNSKTQHIYFLDVPCGDETYVVNFRLEKLYDDDVSEMKAIEEAILKSIKVEKSN